ncbi:MAG: hypothetical protein ACE5FY_05055 [Nitrospiria bacterium]
MDSTSINKIGLIALLCFVLSACVRPSNFLKYPSALQVSLPDARMKYKQGWKSAKEASLLFYDRIAIDDEKAGFFQTTWKVHQVGLIIGTPVKRSRLLVEVANKAPFRLNLSLEQQAFSMELGRWVSDTPDHKRMEEIKERLRARLIF